MKRVFIYCRVSTSSQLDGDGFDRQETTCREFVARKGWAVVRVFREQQSGSDEWSDRKLLSEAMELATGIPQQDKLGAALNGANCGSIAESGVVDTIVVERADRLARDLVVSELFLRECKSKNINVYAADSGEELVNSSGDPTRTLIRQILAAVSQWEKTVIVRKMQAGRKAKKLLLGKPCGGPAPSPYGDRGDIAQKNRERGVIRSIMSFRNNGDSFQTIAARLRNARIPCPNGDIGRRVPGVNPAFQWGYKMVARIVHKWEKRPEVKSEQICDLSIVQ